ncbi:Eukaryotic-type carbonic anhydrase [Phytophthora infestans]|uniref:Carbonic anhydrase n=1 Tax=Phytophthora infestans TaxID=4787 RepID=A0A8S9VDJ2_PHYIN|nr:Eukaryotic-type carbonic anhydrase [Phytophthora infestans]
MVKLLRLLILEMGLLALSRAASTFDSTQKWGYKETTDQELGPNDWHNGYPDCGGKHQSPINFPIREILHIEQWDAEPPLQYAGACRNFTLHKLDDLYRWEIQQDENCTVKTTNKGKREYSVLQFHMHLASEHTIDDYHYDAELHFVHKAVDGSGKLLVMGVFLHAENKTQPNAFTQSLVGDMESSNTTLNLDKIDTNYAEMLNSLVKKNHLMNYSGSLTTPGCSEVVDWWVLIQPISISLADFQKMQTLYGELPVTSNSTDNRPTQPLNDREIIYYFHRAANS